MFGKLKLRQRVLLGGTIPLIVLLGYMGIIYTQIQEADQALSQLENYRTQEDGASRISLHVLGIQRAIRGFLLLKDTTSRNDFETNQELLRSQEDWVRLIQDPQQLETIRRLLDAAAQLRESDRQLIELVDAGRAAEAVSRFQQDRELRKSRELVTDMSTRFLQRAKELRLQYQKKFHAAIQNVRRAILLGTVGSVATAFAVMWWMATSLSRQISGHTSHLATAAGQIAATVAEHERTARLQAAAANETAVTIEALLASSRQSAEQAASMASLAGEAVHSTEEGNAGNRDNLVAMAELKDKIGRMSDHILQLNDQVGQIGIIAVLVRDLAGDINMLALNAAVEATRAGEYGKGFGVVASEVRKLADQSKKSAEQTTGLIGEIQKAASSSIMMTEDSSRMVADAARRAEQVGTLFNQLATMIGNVTMNAQQVMLNAQQQAAAFNQVVEATGSISAGSRETAAGITQTKNALEQLNQAAQNLQAMA